MKKSYIKYIVGGCLVISGLILACLAIAIGGFDVIHNGFSFSWANGIVYNTTESCNLEIDMKEKPFTNLFVDVSTAYLDISYGDVDKIIIEANEISKNHFKAEVNNSTSTLEIRYNLRTIFGFGVHTGTIKITMPKDVKFNMADINLGVGDANLRNINAQMLQIDSGVGTATISDGAAGTVKVDSGVGDINFSNYTSGSFGADTGVGNLNYYGVVDGSVSLSTGVGDVEMTIIGDVKQYGFAVDKGLGDVTLNGMPLSSSSFINGQGVVANTFTISSGVGNVKIMFVERKE